MFLVSDLPPIRCSVSLVVTEKVNVVIRNMQWVGCSKFRIRSRRPAPVFAINGELMSVTISGSIRLQMKLSNDWESRRKYTYESTSELSLPKLQRGRYFSLIAALQSRFDREIVMEGNMCVVSLWT